jgi:transglutaminase-like putative cysteine protease
VRFLANLAEYDAHTPDVRRAAERVVALAGARSALDQAAALHRYVRDRVTFTFEPRETFSPTMRVLELGLGDCDDSARALLALLRSLGHTAGLQTLPCYDGSADYEPTHVACVVRTERGWQWLEATIAAEPGEHPQLAANRLGVRGRGDIG